MEIDNSQMRLAAGRTLNSEFADNEIPALLSLLINGIKNGNDEEDFFKLYKKQWML